MDTRETNNNANSHTWWRLLPSEARSVTAKNAFCIPHPDFTGSSIESIGILYSENPISNVSLVWFHEPEPEVKWSVPRFNVTPLAVRQWQDFPELALMSDLVMINSTASPTDSCYFKSVIQTENFSFGYPDDPVLRLCVKVDGEICPRHVDTR
ncbi:hypothetical protein FI667_g4989, partial [Globisporangium splendens]